jgi:DUF4097 and DUF4098 domain-containing protein YvlB
VASQAKLGAKKGLEALRTAVDDVSKGKINLGWLTNQEAREVVLPLMIPAGKTLRVENHLGDVKIVGGIEPGNVTAYAVFRGASPEEAKAKAEAYTLLIEESDHQVLIKQGDASGTTVDLVIQANGSPNVEVVCETGDVEVLDTGGTARVEAKSGSVNLRGLQGLIDVETQSGDLAVQDSESPSLSLETKSGNIGVARFRGSLNARTASGDVSVDAHGGKTFSIEAVSGDVSFRTEENLAGNLNVRTVSGNARVTLPPGGDYRVALSTLRGAALCEVDLDDAQKSEQRVTGRIGEGTSAIDVSAVTGNVSIVRRDAE